HGRLCEMKICHLGRLFRGYDARLVCATSALGALWEGALERLQLLVPGCARLVGRGGALLCLLLLLVHGVLRRLDVGGKRLVLARRGVDVFRGQRRGQVLSLRRRLS